MKIEIDKKVIGKILCEIFFVFGIISLVLAASFIATEYIGFAIICLIIFSFFDRNITDIKIMTKLEELKQCQRK